MSTRDNININNPDDVKLSTKNLKIGILNSDKSVPETETSLPLRKENLSKDCNTDCLSDVQENGSDRSCKFDCDASDKNASKINVPLYLEGVVQAEASSVKENKSKFSDNHIDNGIGRIGEGDVEKTDNGPVAEVSVKTLHKEDELEPAEEEEHNDNAIVENKTAGIDDTGVAEKVNLFQEESDQIEEPIDIDTYESDNDNYNINSENTNIHTSPRNTSTNGHKYVNYQEEDFKTDSDFEGSSSENEMGSRTMKNKEEAQTSNTPKKQKYSGSSSEDELSYKRLTIARKRQKLSSLTSSKQARDESAEHLQFSTGRKIHPRLVPFRRQWSDKDTLEYRTGYPGKKDTKNHNENLLFYTGKIQSEPNGAYIDEIHEDWYNDLDRLERHHGYIQWLFPIRESGMNWHAQELQQHEAESIQANPKAMERFLRSYKMMLHFYGIRLVCSETGDVKREINWQARFQHLNRSMHNYLRITRILKCLGELGLEHYKVPLLRFMLYEAIQTRTLSRTLESCYCYWIGTVKDDSARLGLKEYANKLCFEADDQKGEDVRSRSLGMVLKQKEVNATSKSGDEKKGMEETEIEIEMRGDQKKFRKTEVDTTASSNEEKRVSPKGNEKVRSNEEKRVSPKGNEKVRSNDEKMNSSKQETNNAVGEKKHLSKKKRNTVANEDQEIKRFTGNVPDFEGCEDGEKKNMEVKQIYTAARTDRDNKKSNEQAINTSTATNGEKKFKEFRQTKITEFCPV